MFAVCLCSSFGLNFIGTFISAQPTLWDIDFANQLALSVNNLPRNTIEEMIQWTKEGKMWQYPVNNEAGE